jgi:hypothetical protein
MDISKITSILLDKVIVEIKREKNLNKIKDNIIDPLVHYTFHRLYPYILGTSIIFILTFLIAVIILLLILIPRGN